MFSYLLRRSIAGMLQLGLLSLLVWLLINYSLPCSGNSGFLAHARIIVDPFICLSPPSLSWPDMIVIAVFVVVVLLLNGQLTRRNKLPIQLERL
jgi:hypothetical protein